MPSGIDSYDEPGRVIVADTDRYLVMLEEMWRCTVDLIVLLSMAYHDAPSEPGRRDGAVPAASALTAAAPDPGAGLLSRLMSEHATLAEIEEALDRLKAGGYGICERCQQPMSADWLAESPLVRNCPDCALDRVPWQPRAAQPSASGVRPEWRRLTAVR